MASDSAAEKTSQSSKDDPPPAGTFASWSPWKLYLMFFVLYSGGLMTFLVMIAEPFTMNTYFSDNSLLPGLVNREFAYTTEAEYYLKSLIKLATKKSTPSEEPQGSLATLPNVVSYIKNELDNFGLEFYEQNFNFMLGGRQLNGTNIYSFIRGERSTSSEAIVLCVPYLKDSQSTTMPSFALSLALAKYFSTKSYWAKDVIFLFVDQYDHGLSTWLDSYHDVKFKSDFKRLTTAKDGLYYDPLQERSGPIQAALVLELKGRQFSRINIKIQGMYGQLPNLDLFNLVAEMAPRESITPYFYDKSLPFGMSELELYQHHLETTLEFMKSQATMQSDGLHGLFLGYSIQSLTIEAPEHNKSDRHVMVASLNNAGRLVEAIFRSLNNLTERFNRSFYFYILVSLRRFTSIGYYMVPFGLILVPILIRAYAIHQKQSQLNQFIGIRAIILLTSALVLSLISTFNISLALMASVVLVPILLII